VLKSVRESACERACLRVHVRECVLIKSACERSRRQSVRRESAREEEIVQERLRLLLRVTTGRVVVVVVCLRGSVVRVRLLMRVTESVREQSVCESVVVVVVVVLLKML
jgi:hypothetical protein